MLTKFVYQNNDETIEKVEVFGGFQFYLGDSTNYFNAFEYQDDMYPGGYEYDTSGYTAYLMDEVSEGVYSITIPLPSNQYFYKYRITFKNGNIEEIKDPSNMPVVNGDSDPNWSLFYVGNKFDASAEQKYIYPRSGHQGRYEFLAYDAVDGTKQPVGVYLPFNYDSNKQYKTIYVSHGGWGNEVEWLTIGSAGNILDNLISEKLTKESIIITMDNDYFGYYGIWSPRDTVLAPLIENSTINENIYRTYQYATYYIGVGNLDIELRQEQEKILHDVLNNIVNADAHLNMLMVLMIVLYGDIYSLIL